MGGQAAWLAALVCSDGVVAGAASPAGESSESRPPWQRLLQGDDKKQAGGLDGRAAVAWQAGRWEEAVRAAEELLELRRKVQGKDHWQAVNARWQVLALRTVQGH